MRYDHHRRQASGTRVSEQQASQLGLGDQVAARSRRGLRLAAGSTGPVLWVLRSFIHANSRRVLESSTCPWPARMCTPIFRFSSP